jgi:glutamine synthetase
MMANGLVEGLRQKGIHRVKIGGFDIDGVLRGKYVSLDKLASALDGGFGFCDVIFGWDIADALYDAKSVTGWERGFPDVTAVLDPTTLRAIPWEPGVAAILCDFRDDSGGPHPACPRSLLKTMRDRAKAAGFEAKFSCEYEFFLFRESPQSLHDKGFQKLASLTPGMFGYSWVRSGQNHALVKDILEGMAAFDIEIEGLHTETGPGVYEAAIRYDELLRAADKAALFKPAMKQIASAHELSVTFMAKWNEKLPGSSGHLHQSLWKDGKNAFFADGKPSKSMRHYIGGLCALMPEVTALVSPNVNTYKRYVPGVWAPMSATWGVENRTAGVRVIGLGSAKTARIEFRQSAADINPYIAMAVCLGAGLWGIENEVEPPPEAGGDATFSGTPLPRSLEQATELLAKSERARAVLGDAFVDHYVHTRRWEVREFARAVTDWELKRYFEAV